MRSVSGDSPAATATSSIERAPGRLNLQGRYGIEVERHRLVDVLDAIRPLATA